VKKKITFIFFLNVYISIFSIFFLSSLFAQEQIIKNNEKIQNKWMELEEYSFSNELQRETHSVLISQNGKIVYEKYAHGWQAEQKHHSWSIAKTISAMLVFAAIDDGYLKLDTSLAELPLDLKSKSCLDNDGVKKTLKIKHLITMSSGLKFSEKYETGPFYSSVISMLYGIGQQNMGQYVLCLPQKTEPGKLFEYSSGDTNVLMMALASTLPNSLRANYPWLRLFDPLEMNVTWEVDGINTPVGSSWIYMKPRDYLKLGELILNKGKYKNKQIISKDSILEIAKVGEVNFQELTLKNYASNYYEKPNLIYGHGSWLNKTIEVKDLKLNKAYKNITENIFFFLGHQGQSITVLPDLNAVILRLGNDSAKSFLREKFLEIAIRALEDSK